MHCSKCEMLVELDLLTWDKAKTRRWAGSNASASIAISADFQSRDITPVQPHLPDSAEAAKSAHATPL